MPLPINNLCKKVALVFIFFMLTFCKNEKIGENKRDYFEILHLVKMFYPDFQILRYEDLTNDLRDYLKEIQLNEHPGWIRDDFNGDGINDYATLLWKKEIKKDGKVYRYNKFVIFISKDKNLVPLEIFEENYEDIYETNKCIPFQYRKSHTDIFLRTGSDEECHYEKFEGGLTTIGNRKIPVVKLEGDCIPENIRHSGVCGLYLTWGYSWYLDKIPAGELVKHTEAFEVEPGEPEEVILKFPAVEFILFESASSVYYWDEETQKIKVIPTSD